MANGKKNLTERSGGQFNQHQGKQFRPDNGCKSRCWPGYYFNTDYFSFKLIFANAAM
ncbi:MAG: hypothetical protein N6V49_03025 [Serratia symbiotica]|nr:hypothetical protein [Serratia symbiotica]